MDSRENSPKNVGYKNRNDSAKSKITRAESPRLKDIGWGFGGKGNDSAKSNVLRSEFRAKSRQSVKSSRSSRSVDSAGSDKRRSTDSAGSYKRCVLWLLQRNYTIKNKPDNNRSLKTWTFCKLGNHNLSPWSLYLLPIQFTWYVYENAINGFQSYQFHYKLTLFSNSFMINKVLKLCWRNKWLFQKIILLSCPTLSHTYMNKLILNISYFRDDSRSDQILNGIQ